MKILDGSNSLRSLQDIEIHLTDVEATQLLEEVADLRHDLAEGGMSESHATISGTGSEEITIFVYDSEDELQSEVAQRQADES